MGFSLALKRAGASSELHVYVGAGHGFGLRESNKAASFHMDRPLPRLARQATETLSPLTGCFDA
jgi:acetyl esterase/lipase